MSTRDVDVEGRLRALPSVDDVLRSDACRALSTRFPHWALAAAARAEIEERRTRLRTGADPMPDPVDRDALERRATTLVRPSLRRVLNATGVVLHTNLGRAPLPLRVLDRVAEIARGYSTLEYNAEARERGSRHDHVAGLLRELCGAEAAAVVNNNAGAVLAALAVAAGREVVVSRGELVEIGGGFRIPDVMRWSGARLREVGTTNKTHVGDYRDALGPETGLLLKVHRSNFAMVGFCAEVTVKELVALGRERRLPVMFDLGSGSLVDLAPLGLPGEPTVPEIVTAGADLVTFSGDKLLGGPQAGLIVGRTEAVAAVRRHPLMRALRPDKLTLAALEATLEIYRDGTALTEIPALRMLAAPPAVLAARKDHLVTALSSAAPRLRVDAVSAQAAVGGGALPLAELPTWVVTLRHARLSADDLAERLAGATPPVIARIADGALLLDVRTLADDEIVETATTVAAAVAGAEGVS